jgi:hypothetical protein
MPWWAWLAIGVALLLGAVVGGTVVLLYVGRGLWG